MHLGLICLLFLSDCSLIIAMLKQLALSPKIRCSGWGEAGVEDRQPGAWGTAVRGACQSLGTSVWGRCPPCSPHLPQGKRTRLQGASSPHVTGGDHVLKAAWAASHDNHTGWLLRPDVPCNALSGLLPLLGTGFFSRELEAARLWKPNQAISKDSFPPQI